MKTRNFVLFAAGIAAAISINVGTAAAQAKSDTRIPVRKDQPPVAAPKTDTVRVYVHDTVQVRVKPDTIVRTVTVAGPTVTMHDTVMQMLPLQKLPGVYFGLGAGVASPTNHFRDNIHDGLDLNGQLGWFPTNGNIGLRADVNYANFAHRKTDCLGCPDTKLLSVMGDVVLRMPLDRTSHINPVFYVMGGGGWDKFSDFIPYRNVDGRIVVANQNTNVSNPVATSLGVTAASLPSGSNNWDWNVGAGLDWTLLGLHWFGETRYVAINTTGGNTHYLPSIIGLKFY
jgi:hypothetical protein